MAECIVATRTRTGICTACIHAGHACRTLRVDAALGTTCRRTSYIVVEAGTDSAIARWLALGVGATG